MSKLNVDNSVVIGFTDSGFWGYLKGIFLRWQLHFTILVMNVIAWWLGIAVVGEEYSWIDTVATVFLHYAICSVFFIAAFPVLVVWDVYGRRLVNRSREKKFVVLRRLWEKYANVPYIIMSGDNEFIGIVPGSVVEISYYQVRRDISIAIKQLGNYLWCLIYPLKSTALALIVFIAFYTMWFDQDILKTPLPDERAKILFASIFDKFHRYIFLTYFVYMMVLVYVSIMDRNFSRTFVYIDYYGRDIRRRLSWHCPNIASVNSFTIAPATENDVRRISEAKSDLKKILSNASESGYDFPKIK